MPEVQPIPSNTQFLDLTGKVFGRLTIESYAGVRKKNAYWNCLCECGKRKIIGGIKLKTGKAKSCGCLRREISIARFTTHGATGTAEYKIWKGMKRRCENPHEKYYPDYGGRGIVVCERWQDFANFLADMGPRPSPKHSVDRFPNQNGNYEPGNCRWATKIQQARNARSNHLITCRGETKTLSEWCEVVGLQQSTISQRIKRGMSDEDALFAPLKNTRKSKIAG